MKKIRYYSLAIKLIWNERKNANCRAKWRRIIKQLERYEVQNESE